MTIHATIQKNLPITGKMKQVYDDGGRSKYFKASGVSDCVTRAVAIATRKDYKEVYDTITKICGYTPRNGVKPSDSRKIMKHYNAVWHPLMQIGSGCKHHLCEGEIPMEGTIICRLSKHLVCVINGVIHDTYDASRDGRRCVYGYWKFNQ